MPRLRTTLALSVTALLFCVGATALLSSVQRLGGAVTLNPGSSAVTHAPTPAPAHRHRTHATPKPRVTPKPPPLVDPQPVFSPKPIYPIQALRMQRGGLVKVRVHLDDAGQVTAAELDASSGDRTLDQAALAAARRWRFEMPAHARHVVVVPIRFQIDAR